VTAVRLEVSSDVTVPGPRTLGARAAPIRGRELMLLAGGSSSRPRVDRSRGINRHHPRRLIAVRAVPSSSLSCARLGAFSWPQASKSERLQSLNSHRVVASPAAYAPQGTSVPSSAFDEARSPGRSDRSCNRARPGRRLILIPPRVTYTGGGRRPALSEPLARNVCHAEGRGFESLHPLHQNPLVTGGFAL
jgi:hypothetical protein